MKSVQLRFITLSTPYDIDVFTHTLLIELQTQGERSLRKIRELLSNLPYHVNIFLRLRYGLLALSM